MGPPADPCSTPTGINFINITSASEEKTEKGPAKNVDSKVYTLQSNPYPRRRKQEDVSCGSTATWTCPVVFVAKSNHLLNTGVRYVFNAVSSKDFITFYVISIFLEDPTGSRHRQLRCTPSYWKSIPPYPSQVERTNELYFINR